MNGIFCLSVCLSVRLSVCMYVCMSLCLSVRHTFLTMFPSSYHRENFKSYHQGPGKRSKGPGQRSKVKVTEVTTQLNRFWTVTPVWIHIWWWNDTYSLMLLGRGALLFFKVIHQISRSQLMFGKMVYAPLFGSSPNIRWSSPNFH